LTPEGYSTGSELKALLDQGAISIDSMMTISGLDREALEYVISTDRGPSGLVSGHSAISAEDSARLSALVAKLRQGLAIADDDRVAGIIQTLTGQFHLTYRQLGLLVGIPSEELKNMTRVNSEVSTALKYSAGLRLSYLLLAIAVAAPRD
jgi:hypothetical protein